MALPVAQRELAPGKLSRPRVNSFDVFDTLIARRCIAPRRIFELMETRTRLQGFAAARIEAERALAGRPYSLEMIYQGVGARLLLGVAQAQELKSVEIAIEEENVIPIAENLAAVADGDILISDMYLAPADIERLLRKAGLDRQAALVVSSDGKLCGRVWPEVLDIFEIAGHLGDDAHTDGVSARQAGIQSRRTEVAKPIRIEATLLEIGLSDLASFARESRLGHWSADPELRALQLAQATYNLPILTIASVLLLRLAERLKARTILFSSRDCNLWLPICSAIAEATDTPCDMKYFFTSRMARVQPSEDYLAYARSLIDERTIVADLCGTGWSLAHLFQQIGRREQQLAFLHRLQPRADYESVARTPDTASVHQLLAHVEGSNNTAIEMCNYAGHGMVVDVRRALGCPVPVLAPDHRSERVKVAIAAQRAVAEAYTKSLRTIGLAETLTASDETLAAVAGALYQGLSSNHAVYLRYLAEHNAEDAAARRALGCAV
jgi:hypothetical protein